MDGRVSLISFPETVDVQSIAVSFDLLRQAFGAASAVEIDLAAVTDADLTCIQLIESARRSAAQAGNPIRLAQSASGAVLEILQRGGFLGHDPQSAAFWMAR